MQTVATNTGKNGGEFQGPSHADGGIKTVVVDTGKPIEVEGGETILNKRSMASQEVVTCTGTPKQVASKLNELEGGVSFASGASCTTVRQMAAKGLFINPKNQTRNSMNNSVKFIKDEHSVSRGRNDVYNFQFADSKGRSASGVVKYNPAINEFDVDVEDTDNTFSPEATEASYRDVTGLVLTEFKPHMDEHYENTKMAWGGFLATSRAQVQANPDNKKVIENKVNDFSRNVHTLREDYRQGHLTGKEYAENKSQLISQYNPYLIQAAAYDIHINPADLMVSSALKQDDSYLKEQGGRAANGADISGERARLKYEAHEMSKLFKITGRTDRDYPSWYGKVVDIENYIKENKGLIDDYDPMDNWETSLFKFDLVANEASNTEELELAARGTIIRSSDQTKRPSPAISATVYPSGYKMEGNDGNLWEIHEDSRGIHRWVKVHEAEDGMEMAADGLWIKGAIQHPGIVRRKAKEMGLIHGDQTLSETDLHKIEMLGGNWPKRVQLARTLKSFHTEKAECGCELAAKAENGGDLKVGTGVFGENEFWRVTSKSTNDIGVFPKNKYTEEEAKQEFATKYGIAADGVEIGSFKYNTGDIVYVYQRHNFNKDVMDKDEQKEYHAVDQKYIVGSDKDHNKQKWSKVEILEPWSSEVGWESYKVKQLDGYRKENEFVAYQSQMATTNDGPIAIGYMKSGGTIESPKFYNPIVNKETETIRFVNTSEVNRAKQYLLDNGVNKDYFSVHGTHATNLSFINSATFHHALELLGLDKKKADDGLEISSEYNPIIREEEQWILFQNIEDTNSVINYLINSGVSRDSFIQAEPGNKKLKFNNNDTFNRALGILNLSAPEFKRIMKQEGDEDVKVLSPVPKIDLSYFEPYEDQKELRKKVKSFLLSKYRNCKIKNEHTGYDILITSLSIDKLVFKSGITKLNCIIHLEEIIKNATPYSVQEITKFNNPLKTTAKFIYDFESYIFIDGVMYDFGLRTFVLDDTTTQIYSGYLDIKNPI